MAQEHGTEQELAESAAAAETQDTGIADELLALEKRYMAGDEGPGRADRAGPHRQSVHRDGRAGRGPDRSRSVRGHDAVDKRQDRGRAISPDVQVVPLGPDAAVLAYTVHERLAVDGKSVTIDAADASTWVRRGGRWRCALHTESIQGDPFGRDRRTA